MIRKIFSAIALMLIFAVAVKAQQTDSRITAILDKEPSENATQLNTNAAETAQLGEEGIVNLLTMLQPSGKEDNTRIFDAISGFSLYVTQKDREVWRAMTVRAYCRALSKINDKDNQAFVISQLQMVGKDDAISTLKNYLDDERLCDPASRALVKINSPASKAALLQALRSSQGPCKLSLVEALGDSRNNNAVKSISALTGTDKKVDKVALYALANIADPISINLMANAAQKAGFTYDETNATSAYLLYIQNLSKKGKGNVVIAIRLAKTLLTKAGLANQVQTHTAALKLLVDMQGTKSMPSLLEAAHNNNPQYRDAALKFAGPYINPSTTALWVREMNNANTGNKVAIVRMLGDNRAVAALPAVLKQLKSEDKEVVIAAITASGRIGQDKVLSNLLQVMKTGDTEEIAAVQNAILIMKGQSVITKVSNALPDMPANAKVVLINFLAARQAHDKIDIVTPLLMSKDQNVRSATYASLKQLAGKDNLEQLFGLLALSSIQPTEAADLQAAIVAVLAQMKDKSAQSTLVLAQMDKAPADKKALYFNILASIGDKMSLAAVSKAFVQGDAGTK